jgi:hypothetical protein
MGREVWKRRYSSSISERVYHLKIVEGYSKGRGLTLRPFLNIY